MSVALTRHLKSFKCLMLPIGPNSQFECKLGKECKVPAMHDLRENGLKAASTKSSEDAQMKLKAKLEVAADKHTREHKKRKSPIDDELLQGLEGLTLNCRLAKKTKAKGGAD